MSLVTFYRMIAKKVSDATWTTWESPGSADLTGVHSAFPITPSAMVLRQALRPLDFSVTTADGTQTTCGSYTVPNDSALVVKMLVKALNTDLSTSCSWEVLVSARNDGGTVTIEGGGGLILGPTDSATAWVVTVDVSGVLLRLRVTGAAATTIEWRTRWSLG